MSSGRQFRFARRLCEETQGAGGEESASARSPRARRALRARFGALAFTLPAQAGDPLPQPPPSSTGSADLSVQVVADVPEEGTPDTQPPAPAAAPPPAIDASPVDDAVKPVETPVNEAPAPAPPEPSPPAEPVAPVASPPTVSSEPVRAVSPARPTRKAVPQDRAHGPVRQYQEPEPQYQSTPAGSHEIAGGQSGNGVVPAPSGRSPDIKSNGWNCTENIPDPSPLCLPNVCQSSSWNCCWIDTCTSGIPAVEDPSTPAVPEPPTQPICTDSNQPEVNRVRSISRTKGSISRRRDPAKRSPATSPSSTRASRLRLSLPAPTQRRPPPLRRATCQMRWSPRRHPSFRKRPRFRANPRAQRPL